MDRQQNYGFLLRDVSQRYTDRFEQHARQLALTLMQCKVLVHLDKNEGISQARLAQLTAIEPMMMVRLLNRMEEERFLERRSDPVDRRARRLYLTEQARPLVDEIWRLAAKTRAEMFANVSRQDRETFLRVLEQAQQNLTDLPQVQMKA